MCCKSGDYKNSSSGEKLTWASDADEQRKQEKVDM